MQNRYKHANCRKWVWLKNYWPILTTLVGSRWLSAAFPAAIDLTEEANAIAGSKDD